MKLENPFTRHSQLKWSLFTGKIWTRELQGFGITTSSTNTYYFLNILSPVFNNWHNSLLNSLMWAWRFTFISILSHTTRYSNKTNWLQTLMHRCSQTSLAKISNFNAVFFNILYLISGVRATQSGVLHVISHSHSSTQLGVRLTQLLVPQTHLEHLPKSLSTMAWYSIDTGPLYKKWTIEMKSQLIHFIHTHFSGWIKSRCPTFKTLPTSIVLGSMSCFVCAFHRLTLDTYQKTEWQRRHVTFSMDKEWTWLNKGYVCW